MPQPLQQADRPDLIPTCCADFQPEYTTPGPCQPEIVEGSYNGIGVFWAQHGTNSVACQTAAEAKAWIEGQHGIVSAAEVAAAKAAGVVVETGNGEATVEIEGAPA